MKSSLTKKQFIENIRILADTFLNLAEACPEDEVDMLIPHFHLCQTIACHAGHFALARDKEKSYNYHCYDSADEMAQFLGFVKRERLEIWARRNPLSWGNTYGDYMFCENMAFGKTSQEALTLTDIGLHWHGVADRLEAQRELKNTL